MHDRDVTAEKADINAETASEKIDLWNIPPGKRPPAYEKYPLETPKDKKIVCIGDIVRKLKKYMNRSNFIF
jgi:phosphatidylserine decarboxylase